MTDPAYWPSGAFTLTGPARGWLRQAGERGLPSEARVPGAAVAVGRGALPL